MITMTGHQCLFPCQPPEGSFLDPGPCRCGKTYPRSQAEKMLREALAAMDATEPEGMATLEHATVDDFRRELVQDSGRWQEAADRHRACAYQKDAAPAVRDGYVGNLMAAGYGYALAAVLGTACREFGEAVARRLAFTAASVLTDGDGSDLNADVRGTDPPGSE